MSSKPTTSQALIDAARAALERLAAGSPTGQVAYAAIDALDRAWPATPLTVGIAGADAGARMAVFDVLGGGALDGVEETRRSVPLRARRAPRSGFVAAFADGTTERQFRHARGPTADDPGVQAAQAQFDAAVAVRDDKWRAASAAEQVLPAVIRTRPPVWAVWAWIWRWIASLTRRREVAAHARAKAAIADADDTVERTTRAVLAAREDARAPARRYAVRLAAVCAGRAPADDPGNPGDAVKYVELEVADGPLPDDVVVIEVGSADDADGLDRVLEVRAGGLYLDAAVSDSVPGSPAPRAGDRRRIGDVATAAAQLGTLALAGRAARLTREAIATIREASRAFDDMLEGIEADYKKRIEPLEAMRLPDPAGFIDTQLAVVKPHINASISAIMEHGYAHLGSELATVAQSWADLIGAATSRDELKDAITRVDFEWSAATARAGDETRLLIQGGVGGSAHDLHAELVAPLAAYGLPPEYLRTPRAAPELPAIEILPSLDGATVAKLDTASWLGSLFRSFDTRRADVLATLTARIDKIREVVRAEMLDAEPKLHAVLIAAATATLTKAVDTHRTWLDGELARERAQIDRDRAALGPLIAARDAARTDARKLGDMTVALELGS